MLGLLIVAISAAVIATMALTGIGAHRRGRGLTLSVVSGLAFPATWVIWYLRDEEPYAAR